MPAKNAIVIAVDGLRASALGAYGNTWFPTHACDELASESLVCDVVWSNRPTREGFYSSAWGGSQPLPQVLTDAGVETALTTDDAWVADHAEACGFSEVRCLEVHAEQSAGAIAETEMAQLFAIAIDQLEAWRRAKAATVDAAPRLLWLHSRGFHGAWDAPMELRQSLLDEDELPAPTYLSPPTDAAVDDHDHLLLHRAAYAAQAIVLDECVGALTAAIAELALEASTLLVLVGCRGFALGEHGAVGSEALNLYSELLHVPCLLRLPGTEFPPPRSPQLLLTSDLAPTLAEWFAATAPVIEDVRTLLPKASHVAHPGRESIMAASEHGERAVRTSAWMLRQPPLGSSSDSPPTPQLFVKPDDRWEANEVADRAPEAATQLLALLNENGTGEQNTTAEAARVGETIAPPDDR